MALRFLTSRYAAVLLFVYALFFALVVTGLKPLDPDLFFILTHGRDIFTTGRVTTTLLHTVHEGFATIIPQAGTDCVDFLFFSVFGYYGLYFLFIIFFAITATAAYIYISERVDYDITSGIIILSLIIPVMSMYDNGRPQMVTQLIFYLLLLTMDMKPKRIPLPVPAVLFFWPLLSIAQANFHSTLWPFLIVTAFAFALPDIVHFPGAVKRESVERIAAAALMIPAGVINPNGINGITFFIKYELTKGSSVPIAELQSPHLISLNSFYALVSVLVLIAYVYRYRGKLMMEYILPNISLTFLGLLFDRCSWMIAFSLLPMLCILVRDEIRQLPPAPAFSDIYDEYGDVSYKKLVRSPDVIYPAVAVVFFTLAIFSNMIYVDIGGNAVANSEPTPVGAYRYLEAAVADKDTARVYTSYNNGAFLEFMGYTIYIDARQEPYTKSINKKADILGEYTALVMDPDYDYDAFLERYGFDYLVVSKKEPLYIYLRAGDSYEKVYEDEFCVVMEPSSSDGEADDGASL